MLSSWFGQSSFNKKCEKSKVTIKVKSYNKSENFFLFSSSESEMYRIKSKCVLKVKNKNFFMNLRNIRRFWTFFFTL